MQNYKLTIAYDGTDFVGWQRQSLPGANNRSVQETLEKALSKLLRQTVSLQGAGRTDSGVHALGQVASFQAETTLPAENLAYALNGRLPNDVRVIKCEKAAPGFHARFSAHRKTYEYYLANQTQASAFDWRNFYICNYRLDLALMQECAGLFVGRHDFKSFAAKGSNVKDYVREIYRCDWAPVTVSNQLPWSQPENLWRLTVSGNGFVYKQVRLIMGALIAVGRGRLKAEDIKAALLAPADIIAPPAPPHGLYMKEVVYRSACKTDGIIMI
jgi:tRNA pseudouridine38-40 synthase